MPFKNKITFKQASIILNITLVGALLAVLILKGGQPQQQEFNEEHAQEAAEKTAEKHEHSPDEHGVAGRIAMTERQVKLNGVEVLTAGPTSIRTTLSLNGEIQVNADKSVQIVPRLPGIVESVSANAGDKVSKGQVLAVISSQSMADQRSELLAAEQRLSLTRITYEREKRLWEEKISAEQDYLQARQAMQEAEISVRQARQKLQAIGALSENGNLTRYEIRSPIAGVVTTKQIAAGQVIAGAETLYVVSDLSTVWVDMQVYAQDISAIKAGQPVVVKSSAMNEHASGKVAYVGALVGEASRTATARAVLPNPEGTWRPGLPVTVELQAEEVSVPLAVSVEGLQDLKGETVVFKREGEFFQSAPIRLGRRDHRYAEVLEGLSAGAQYAAMNSYLIKAELGKSEAEHED
jgi:cobalt-zinc-cadmium efflux system membrane fusion protein